MLLESIEYLDFGVILLIFPVVGIIDVEPKYIELGTLNIQISTILINVGNQIKRNLNPLANNITKDLNYKFSY